MLKVENIMVEDVVTVEADETATKAVELMNKHEIGCLIVTKNRKPIGIVTERDLLKRVLAKSKKPAKLKIWQIMSAPLIFGDLNMDVEDTIKFMLKMKIKKLPIVRSGKLRGLVTLTDLVRFQPQIVTILKKLSALGLPSPPKRLQKVIDYYVV